MARSLVMSRTVVLPEGEPTSPICLLAGVANGERFWNAGSLNLLIGSQSAGPAIVAATGSWIAPAQSGGSRRPA